VIGARDDDDDHPESPADAAASSPILTDQTETTPPDSQPVRAEPGQWARRLTGRRWARHLALIGVYEGLGIAVTWPRFTWLADGKLPATSDASAFVWNLWWVAHQLANFGNPFFTRYMAAPVGTTLAFSTLMPLPGWLLSPVTLLWGPSATFTLLTIITPGLLCYAMYRTARLWLNPPGAIVAGAFFGLSSMLLWQNWYHVNIAIGSIFLPVTIEAAVRFRRRPRVTSAVALGLAIAATILINQETTIVAIILAAVILLPWLVSSAISDRPTLRHAAKPLAIGAAAGLVLASPELIAMLQAITAGAAKPQIGLLAENWTQFGVGLPTLFSPSPRLANFGLSQLSSAYSYADPHQVLEGLPTFGVVLSALALLGIVVGWRNRTTWSFAALWLVCAVLALGTSLTFGSNCHSSAYLKPGTEYGRHCAQYLPLLTHPYKTLVYVPGGPPTGVWRPVAMSNLMPYTWLVRIPGLDGLREADRFAIVGLIGAAMLAGMTVQWLCRRRATMPLIALVVALGALEAGWSGAAPSSPGYHHVMPTTLPRLDGYLAAGHSKSIVVDFPYGLRGGVGITGAEIAPNAMVIATEDGHPRAISYTAWVSPPSAAGIARHAFYRYLYEAEYSELLSPSDRRAARADLRTLHVGWVLMWRNMWTRNSPKRRYAHVYQYLKAVGFVRSKTACLTSVANVRDCPWNHQVWLLKYQPGP
jgi:hypothetical protein